MKSILFILFILTIGIYCEDPFDYLLFVQAVPGTSCKIKKCSPNYGKMPQNQLNMHGMWPNYNNGSWPANCYKAPLYTDNSVASDVLADLNDRWIGLFSSVTSFRDHEWQKHGTCYLTGISNTNAADANMTKYFKDTMTVQKSLDLDKIIYSKTSWDAKELQAALKTKIGGKQMYIDCNGGNLYNVKTCLDKNLNVIDCPASVNTGGKCPANIKILPTPDNIIKNGSTPTPSKVFDFLLFVMENTGAACLARQCSSAFGTIAQNTLNMHGMWPNFEAGGYPETCYAAPSYSDSLLSKETLAIATDQWIGVFADATTFRDHEWQKHGTCYIKGIEESLKFEESNEIDAKMERYFKDTLDAKLKFNLDPIVFSKSTWTYDDFYNTIKKKIGVNFSVDCDKKNNLLELKLCLTPNLELRDCPSTLQGGKKCKKNVNINVLPVPDSILRKTEQSKESIIKKLLEQ